jgi:hypothetical protein
MLRHDELEESFLPDWRHRFLQFSQACANLWIL